MEEFYNRHYISLRSDNAVIDAWSDGPHPEKDTISAICINEHGGYQFRLYFGGEENPPIYDADGIPLYKWDGEQVTARTAEEIEAEKSTLFGSPSARIAEIKRQLVDLDNQAIRPLSAIVTGMYSEEDKTKLQEIEEQKIALRNELAATMSLTTED